MMATCQTMNLKESAVRRKEVWRTAARIAAQMTVRSLILLSLLFTARAVQGQVPAREEDHAVFVSQRNGVSQLYLLDLTTRQVSQISDTGRGQFAPSVASDSGTLVYSELRGAGYEIFRTEVGSAWRTKRATLVGLNRMTVDVTDEVSPSVTSDGQTIAFATTYGIELITPGGSRQILVPTKSEFSDLSPSISPDGRSVAFVSNRGGNFDIWLYERASSELRQVTRDAGVLGGLNWSSDSKQVAFSLTATSSKQTGIAMATVATGAIKVLSEQNDTSPSVSARGDKVIFMSTRDGDPEIYLLNLATGRTDRLTYSAGLDDSPNFLAMPARPTRTTP